MESDTPTGRAGARASGELAPQTCKPCCPQAQARARAQPLTCPSEGSPSTNESTSPPSPVTTADITSPWRLQWNPASRRLSDTSGLSHASGADVGASASSQLKGWGLPGARHLSLSGPGRPGCSLRTHCPGHSCSFAPSHQPAATGASTLAQPQESSPRGDRAQTDPQDCSLGCTHASVHTHVHRQVHTRAHTCTHVHRHTHVQSQ